MEARSIRELSSSLNILASAFHDHLSTSGDMLNRLRDKGVTLFCVAMVAGCSAGGTSGDPRFQVTPETLVGSWTAVPKAVADEHAGAREIRGPGGESAKFRWVFKNDHTYEMSVDARVADIPALAQQGKVSGTWIVLEVRANLLSIELPDDDLKTQVKIIFEGPNKCLYDAGESEMWVLNRVL
jgi:hypothetical protein